MTRSSARKPALRRIALTVLVVATMVLGVAPTAAAPAPTEPTFTDGEAQPVFPTTSTSWINSELWIETEVDSDNDGKKDLVHADVSRVAETDSNNLKVPIVLEVSPYYAGTAVL